MHPRELVEAVAEEEHDGEDEDAREVENDDEIDLCIRVGGEPFLEVVAILLALAWRLELIRELQAYQRCNQDEDSAYGDNRQDLPRGYRDEDQLPLLTPLQNR